MVVGFQQKRATIHHNELFNITGRSSTCNIQATSDDLASHMTPSEIYMLLVLYLNASGSQPPLNAIN